MKNIGCEYCVDTDGWVKPIEKNGHAFVWFNYLGWHLELKAKGWHGVAPINFCPMCGRKLERAIKAVDAVDMRCDNCKWQKDQSGIQDGDAWKWVPCRALITPEDFYCKEWERRTDD